MTSVGGTRCGMHVVRWRYQMRYECCWLEVLDAVWMRSVGVNRNGVDVIGLKY